MQAFWVYIHFSLRERKVLVMASPEHVKQAAFIQLVKFRKKWPPRNVKGHSVHSV